MKFTVRKNFLIIAILPQQESSALVHASLYIVFVINTYLFTRHCKGCIEPLLKGTA